MNTELEAKFKGVTETLADIKQECVKMEAKIANDKKTIDSLEAKVEELKENSQSEDDLLPVKNMQDEMKREACARLYKNLNLEQLENVEKVVKKTVFDGRESNYVLEIP